MTELPTLNNEQMIDLAKSAAHSYALSQESFTHRAMNDYIDSYVEAFAMAYKNIETRIKEKNKLSENFNTADLEPLSVNKIL